MKLVKAPPTPTAVKHDIDTLFERLFRGPMFPDVFPMRAIESAWEPALDFSETEKEYLVRLEVPGFHRENLDVKFDAGLLTISGHRELQSEAKGEEYLWQERQAGRFARTLRLPAPVAGDKIEAAYENGMLVVHLPKLEPATTSRIAIK